MKVSSKSSASFTPCPEGNHPARCIGIVDLGTQIGEYEGKATKSRKVMIMFEILNQYYEVTEKDSDAQIKKRYQVRREFTASLVKNSKLKKMLEAWRGRAFTSEEENEFDLNSILGKPCMVQVNHSKDGNYANIEAVTSFPKMDGVVAPDPESDLITFDVDGENTDMEKFNSLPQWLQDKISESEEFKKLYGVDEFDSPTPSVPTAKAKAPAPISTPKEEISNKDVEDIFDEDPATNKTPAPQKSTSIPDFE